MNRLVVVAILLAALLVPFGQARAEPVWSADDPPRQLHSYATFFNEPTPTISVAEMAASPHLFRPRTLRPPSLSGSLHWMRLPIANTATDARRLVLDIGVPDALFLEGYKITGGKITPLVIQPRDAPFRARPIPERILAVPFDLAAGENAEILLRYVIHADTPLTLDLGTPERFHDRLAADNLLNGMILGLLAALSLLSLLQYLASRRGVHLIYTGMTAMMAAFLAQFEGYTFAYLWPEHGQWNNMAPVVLALAMQVLHALFTMTIFEMRASPRFRVAYIGYIGLLLVSGTLYLTANLHAPGFAAILLYGPLSVAAGVFFLRRGNFVAGYFLAATVVYVVCNNLLFGLAVFGLGPEISPFVYPRIGYVCEALLFALALAHQTHALRGEIEAGLRRRLAETRRLAEAEIEKNQALLEAQQRQMQLAAAGHDMAQPLAAIRFAVTALRLQQGNETVTRHIDQALNYTESLLRGLMGDAKRDHAERKGEVDMAELMASVAQRHRPAAEAKGLSLRLAPTSVRVRASEEVLLRLLDNLVTNAVRYTQRGGVVIGVRNRPDGPELQVADSGPGFDTKRRAELLAPFAQSGGLASERLGHGLGLHIVKTLCEHSGYRLTIRSAPGRRTIFGILIPHPNLSA